MDNFPNDDRLYTLARIITHEHGLNWTDPRTGKVYPWPRPVKEDKSKRKKAGPANRHRTG